MTLQDKAREILDDFALTYTSEYVSIDSKLEREVIDFEECLARKETAYDNALQEALSTLALAFKEEVEQIIGDDPEFADKEPQYVQKIKSHVIKVKNAQRARLNKTIEEK